MKKFTTLIGVGALLVAGSVSAANVLTQTPQGSYPNNVLYGSAWTEMTALLTAKHTITSTADFSDLSELNNYDAVWVDQEYQGTLTGAEITALTDYVTAGGKLVLVGENDSWNAWNTSILAIVGGSFIGQCSNEAGTPTSANVLTTGVGSVVSACASRLTNTGSPDVLFSNDLAGVYSVGAGEALVFLDSNWNDDTRINGFDNAVFAQNIVDWIGEPTAAPKYTVGGTVSGLSGSVTLTNNGADDLVVSANGAFEFATALDDASGYLVAVSVQPVGQTCSVGNGGGTIASADVTNVTVTCANNPPPPIQREPTAVPVDSKWSLALLTLSLMLLGGWVLARQR